MKVGTVLQLLGDARWVSVDLGLTSHQMKMFVLFAGEFLANSMMYDAFMGKNSSPNVFSGFMEFCSVLLHLTVSGLSCLFLERLLRIVINFLCHFSHEGNGYRQVVQR